MYRTYIRWRSDRSGATAIEYALLASIIAVAVVGLIAMMTSTDGMYGRIRVAFETYMP